MNNIDLMDKYKGEFAVKFEQFMENNLSSLKEEQKKYGFDLSLFPFLFCFSGFVLILLTDYPRYTLFFQCFYSTVYLFVAVILWVYLSNKCYQQELKNKVYAPFLNIFGNLRYNKTQLIPDSVLEKSDLFDKFFKTHAIEKFGGWHNNVKFKINKFKICRFKKGMDIYKFYKYRPYKGIVLHFRMKKHFNARLLIFPKNFERSILSNYERIVVEGENFNNHYDIWVEKTSRDDSRHNDVKYLLNTAFLDKFIQLKTTFKAKSIKCSVYGDSILIFLESNKDLIRLSHLFKRIDDINQYKHLFDEFASVFSFIDVLNLSSKIKLS